MSGPRRALTADERMADLERGRERVRRERMLREVAGPRWQRMVRIVPALFDRQGEVHARILTAGRDAVIEALAPDAVFALDTAMRLARGYGFLRGGDVHCYLLDAEAMARVAERGLVSLVPYGDRVLLRPWSGPPRLLACVLPTFPPHRTLDSGLRVVDDDRLRRELIGAVGPRPDLFALAE